MAKILFGTTFIMPDEPCLGLYEMNLPTPDSRGIHRYQIVYVMRGQKPAEFRRDMGDSKKFKEEQLRLPGGAYDETEGKYYVEHSVGELMTMADQWRAKPTFQDRELTHVEGRALWQKVADQIEQKKNNKKGRLVYGR